VLASVEGDGFGRFPQEIEAAVYFCCLEALQNAAKYASTASVTIALSASNADLTFSVADDGVGFDPTTAARGAGLTNMRDRLEALGGTFEIHSAPNRGTTLRGRIPVPPT
jgi:signal transduction histidine kinase